MSLWLQRQIRLVKTTHFSSTPDLSLNLTEFISQCRHLFPNDKVNMFISLLKTEINRYIFLVLFSSHRSINCCFSLCTSHHFHHSSPIHHPIPVSSFWTHLSIFLRPHVGIRCRSRTRFLSPAMAVLAGATTKCVPVRPKSDWLTTCCYGRSLENPLPDPQTILP